MAQRRALIENQAVAKHVESLPIPYLDESSNLSGSTNEKTLERPVLQGFLFLAILNFVLEYGNRVRKSVKLFSSKDGKI